MSRNTNQPYLSIVLVSRNDKHGEEIRHRTQVCVNGIITQMEKYKISSELVLVEWLPPKDRPLLKDIYPWPKKLNYCAARVIVVRPKDVEGYEYSDEFSIRDLTPWNVGIRRAKGKFILSTVTDILLSDELARAFQEGKLRDKTLYRVDRCDVNRKVLDIKTLAEQLKYCRLNIIDMHTLTWIKYIKRWQQRLPVLHDKTPGDFILLSKNRWHDLHGFPQGILGGADNVFIYMAHFNGIRQKIFRKPKRLYHIDHDSKWKNPDYVKLRKLYFSRHYPMWLVDLKAAIGSKNSTKNSKVLKENLPLRTPEQIKEIIQGMSKRKSPFTYNDDNWGVGGCDFEEFIVAGGEIN